MTAQDLTALADKLDELGADALAQGHKLADPLSHAWNEAAKDQSASFRRGVALVEQHRTLLAASAALREAARLREAEKITLMLASFKDPRTVSCPDEELELFAKIIEDAKALHGDLHEDEEPGHGA